MVRRVIEAYREAVRGLPRDIWVLCAIMLVNRAGTMVLPFLALFLTIDRGLGPAAAGQLVGLYGLGSIAGSWLGGWLSDRLGATRTLLATLLATGFGFLGFLVLESVPQLAAGVFVVAVVSEGFRPAAMTLCAELAPEGTAARAFALMRLAVNLGMAIGPAAGGLLAVYDYDWIFLGDAATCFAAMVLVWLYLPRVAAGHAGPVEAGAPASRTPWRDGPFLLLLLWCVLYASVLFQVFSTLPLYLNRFYGFREDGIGLLLGWNALLIVAFEMLLVQWAGRRDPLRLIALGGLATCAGFAVLPLGRSVALALLSVSIWSFGEMLVLPFLNVVVAGRAGRRHRGRYMGAYTMSYSLAFVIGPPVGAWVLERFGEGWLWYGSGAVGVLLLVMALALSAPLRGRHGEAAPA